MKKTIGYLLVSVLISGCSSISRYYVANPAAAQFELADYEGPLEAQSIPSADVDSLVSRMLAEDYVLIGTADFTGNSELDWCGAMVRLGEELKAEKLYYTFGYIGTEHSVGYMSVPTMSSSTATVWGHRGPRTVNVATYGSQVVPYDYSYAMNAYSVMYFKKNRKPSAFGIVFGSPDDNLARKIGTRKAMVINTVIPGKIAWKNDLFVGDIILEVDGEKATEEVVAALCSSCQGKKLKIQRDEAIIEKTLW